MWNPLSVFRRAKSHRSSAPSMRVATLTAGDGNNWDVSGGDVDAEVYRMAPKAHNGHTIKGSLQEGKAFRIESREDLLQEIAASWGGGSYKAYLKSGAGATRAHLGTVKFDLPNDPLDGDGNEIGAEDDGSPQPRGRSRRRGEKDRVAEAQVGVELAKAAAEKKGILEAAGINEGEEPSREQSSEVTMLMETVESLQEQVKTQADDAREKHREEVEDRRHGEMVALIEAMGNRGNSGGDSLEAMKMMVESQSSVQKAVIEAQAKMQEALEKTRSEAARRTEEMATASAEKSESFMRLMMEIVEKGAGQREELMRILLKEKTSAGKEYIELIKDATQAAREMNSPADAPTSTLDVVQSVADRFLGVIELGLQAKGAQPINPDDIRGMIRQAAEEVVAEESGEPKVLPAPRDDGVATTREAFDHVLEAIMSNIKSGGDGSQWMALARKTLPQSIIVEFLKANTSGDTKAVVGIMQRYGSPELVSQVVAIAAAKGKEEDSVDGAQAPPQSVSHPTLRVVRRPSAPVSARPSNPPKEPKVEELKVESEVEPEVKPEVEPKVEEPKVEEPKVESEVEPEIEPSKPSKPKGASKRRRRAKKKKAKS